MSGPRFSDALRVSCLLASLVACSSSPTQPDAGSGGAVDAGARGAAGAAGHASGAMSGSSGGSTGGSGGAIGGAAGTSRPTGGAGPGSAGAPPSSTGGRDAGTDAPHTRDAADPVLPSPPRGALHPSADGHHLVDADGKPFFWLADSIYAGLYSYASLADVAEYLDVRRRQGFTVIKTLVPNDSTDSADPDGHRIVQDGDWSRPNPAFFARVDAVLDMARDRGMIIVLLFRADTPALAEWMARRYRDRTNVLWWVWDDYQPTIAAVAKGVTGRDVKTDAADPAWPALGFGIYAPAGDERNAWRAPWTAMATIRDVDFGKMAEAWALQPAKPSVRGDGCYEAHPYARGPFPQSPYWHFLSGTAFTYGYDRPVWEFADGWRTMLDSDGARQTALFARFFTARPWWTLEPDQTLLDRPAEGTVAARTHDRSAAYVFVADRATVRLRAGAVDGAHKAFWFDPRTGDTRDVAAIGAAAVELTPPWPEALLAVE